MRSWNREGEYDQPPELDVAIGRRKDGSPWRVVCREDGKIRGLAIVAEDGASVLTNAGARDATPHGYACRVASAALRDALARWVAEHG